MQAIGRISGPAALVVLVVGVASCGGGATDPTETGAAETEPSPTAAVETSAVQSEATADVDAAAVVEGAVVEGAVVEDGGAAPEAEERPVLPVTVTDAAGNEVTVESVDRIIPLDGTVAEVVFALGLGDNVVATDLSATYPAAADALPEIGYQRALAAEPVAGFEPTVLLATDIAGPPETLDDLRALGYPVVIVPNNATAEGPGQKVRAVAAALGVSGRGEALADSIDQTIEQISVADQEGDRPTVAALYLRGPSAQLVLGRNSATHWLIEAAGGIDVADELGLDESAPVTAEAILNADPDILLVPEAGLASVNGIEGLLQIEGLGRTSAGQSGLILSYDDQLLLGNGPRVGDLLADLKSEIDAVSRP